MVMATRKKKKASPRRNRANPDNKHDYSYIKVDSSSHINDMYREVMKLHDADDQKFLKSAALSYAKSRGVDTKHISHAKDDYLCILGKYAAIINGGGELTEKYKKSIDDAIDELVSQAKSHKKSSKKVTEEVPEKVVVSIQDRIREQVYEVTCHFDYWYDKLARGNAKKKDAPNPLTMMQTADFKAPHAAQAKKIYENDIEEIKSAINKKDDQLVEGYGCFTKTQLKNMLEFLESIVSAANMISQAKKAQRKVRKPPSIEKRVSKLKYMKTDSEYGLASVDPVTIIGAQALWVFNVRQRKIGKYVAKDVSGLNIKGTSIIGFDEKASIQKTLRKPKEQLPEFMSAGKVQLRKFLDNINTVKTNLNGRVNDSVVLLKVVK